MAFDTVPWIIDGTTVDGEVIRRALGTLISAAGGVVSAGDLAVTQQATPNMSVQIAAGQIWVPGTHTTSQGLYYSRNSGAVTVAISASNPSNPRIDTIIAQVQDAAYGDSLKQLAPAVITGTPTSGATLGNLSGAGTVPASSLVLAYVLVPAAATSIVNADISNVVAAIGAPQTWSPVLSQNASTVASTTLQANYVQSGRTVIGAASVKATAAGSSGHAVVIGVPVATTANTGPIIGSFIYEAVGANMVYSGAIYAVGTLVNGGTTSASAANAFLGITPALAIANNDVLYTSFSYLV